MYGMSKKGMAQVALCLMAMDTAHQLKIKNTKEELEKLVQIFI